MMRTRPSFSSLRWDPLPPLSTQPSFNARRYISGGFGGIGSLLNYNELVSIGQPPITQTLYANKCSISRACLCVSLRIRSNRWRSLRPRLPLAPFVGRGAGPLAKLAIERREVARDSTHEAESRPKSSRCVLHRIVHL